MSADVLYIVYTRTQGTDMSIHVMPGGQDSRWVHTLSQYISTGHGMNLSVVLSNCLDFPEPARQCPGTLLAGYKLKGAIH